MHPADWPKQAWPLELQMRQREADAQEGRKCREQRAGLGGLKPHDLRHVRVHDAMETEPLGTPSVALTTPALRQSSPGHAPHERQPGLRVS